MALSSGKALFFETSISFTAPELLTLMLRLNPTS
jgi:hypothetical protein